MRNLTYINQKKLFLKDNHTIAFRLLLVHAAIKMFKIWKFLVAILVVKVLSYKDLLAINQKEIIKECKILTKIKQMISLKRNL